MARVVGLGAGGHAKVVLDILRECGEHEVVGLLDADEKLWGQAVAGVPVLGGDELLSGLAAQGVSHAFVGVGSAADTGPRRRLYDLALRAGMKLVTAVHPTAVISPSASLGSGVTVMPLAVINAAARIGNNVIVNTSAVIEHDCEIGDHAHIASGAVLASTVNVGEGAHVGVGATVRQWVNIGAAAVVGAGAVVIGDVPPNTVVAGVPARPLHPSAD